jgi:DNA-binding CsgD family transcriptional regulator
MDNDDTSKPEKSLVGSTWAYAELYPDIVRRLREVEQSKNPAVRKRLASLRAALKGREERRTEHMVKTWGLTPTEARLALYLAEGLSVAVYAQSFEVSVGTVRSQLKAIFAKTGVNRQGALVRLVPRF